MLRINFDYKLKFTIHIDRICKKASRKANAFARIAPYGYTETDYFNESIF